MQARNLATILILVLAFALPCAAGEDDRAPEPDKVTVQHILIGFKTSIPGQKLDRTKKEAQALAQELLKRARAGEDFLALVKEYTNDQAPGIYELTNKDAPRVPGARTRDDMVPGFGDVAFSLEVGEVGLAPFNYRLSPFGWHIIKRLE